MQTFGGWVELLGTLVTLIGLFRAYRGFSRVWHRLTAGLEAMPNNLRRFLFGATDVVVNVPTARMTVTAHPVTVTSTTSGTVGVIKASVDIRPEVLSERIDGLSSQYDELDRRVAAELAVIRQEAATDRQTRVTPQQVEDAVKAEVHQLRLTINTDAARDLRIAIGGVLITAVGVFIGVLG